MSPTPEESRLARLAVSTSPQTSAAMAASRALTLAQEMEDRRGMTDAEDAAFERMVEKAEREGRCLCCGQPDEPMCDCERMWRAMMPRPFDRVQVMHPHNYTLRASGFVVGFIDGWYDFGGPESGPGPVEEAQLVVVRCDDGKTIHALPSDVEAAV